MTNADMVKVKGAGGPAARRRRMPEPNPPAPIDKKAFQRDPPYPEIDPLDSTQLKPMLDRK